MTIERTANITGSGLARRRGLTLVELLVVLAVIALLLAILIPAIGVARARARRARCASQLHQIGLALRIYFDSQAIDHPVFPYAHAMPSAWPDHRSIRDALAPFLERDATVFHCPDDSTRFSAEGLSYRYNERLSGKPVIDFERVLEDFDPVHGPADSPGAINVLYADSAVRNSRFGR